MKIKILRLGHSATEIEVPSGSTVKDAIEKSGLPCEGFSLTVNGLTETTGSSLNDGDVLTMVPKVAGGRL